MKSSELYRMLVADGWITIRQDGSHMTMAHPDKKALTRSGNLTVPFHGSHEVNKWLAKAILKEAGLK